MTRRVHEAVAGSCLNDCGKLSIGRIGLGLFGILCEFILIVAVSVSTGAGYHMWAYGDVGVLAHYFGVGAVAAIAFSLPFVVAHDGGLQDLIEGRRSVGRIFLVWNYAFLSLGAAAFFTQTTVIFSRGWLVLLYVCGLVGVVAFEALFRRVLGQLLLAGRLAPRRLMLVGQEHEVENFEADADMRRAGVRIVAAVKLPMPGASEETDFRVILDAAAANARALQIDDVIILTDWSNVKFMNRIVEAFVELPVAVHLGATSLIGRFSEPRIAQFASLRTLSLTAPPLGAFQLMAKRLLDVVVSAFALVLLSPLFAAVAVAIKLDSKGPVFFRQRRRGFNHTEFQIWKFRTMSTLDDGDEIRQAIAGDARVTRVGKYLRNLSLDELPQLFNVLNGEMSLVGPRPHAVAHDKLFEKQIRAYARRLNVRPGITGWAQVNGLRGLTETTEAMRQRVEYDLHYIDNWSIAFDLYILALTILSPKVFRNAH